MSEKNAPVLSSIEKLTETIKLQNEKIKEIDDIGQLEKAIFALEKNNSDNSLQLREAFNQITFILENPKSSPEQLEMAKDQLIVVKELVGTEEENRESTKRQEKANELLSKTVSGINGLADNYDKMVSTLASSSGLLASIGVATLLFMDPETLFDGIKSAIDGAITIIDSIRLFLDGDFSKGFELLSNNIGAAGVIVGTIAVLFGGRIIRLVSSMLKGVQEIIKAVIKVGGFISNLSGRFGGLSKIFGRIFLPFTIITAAISTITGIINGFKKDGIVGSIEGGLSGLFNSLIGWPLDILKDAVGWILGAFGFENTKSALASFSFQNLINDMISKIFDTIESAINWIKDLFPNPITVLKDLTMSLIGPNGILSIITNPIDKAINWIKDLFTIKDSDLNRDYSLYEIITDPIDKAINWIKDLFTDPTNALQQMWNRLVGNGGLIYIIYYPIDKAIGWIQNLFGWKNPKELFKFSEFIKDTFITAKNWIVNLFSFNYESDEWSLSTFISNTFVSVKNWIIDQLLFSSNLVINGWTNLTDFISSKFISVKDWFIGLFSWSSNGLSNGWTNLTDFVKGKWTVTKEWITGLFDWSASEDEENFIQNLFNTTIEKIKDFFTNLFDFIPSIEDVKSVLTSMLPQWMQPVSIEDRRAELLKQLAQMEAAAAKTLPAAEQFDNPLTNDTKEDFEAEAAAIRAQLDALPQANNGGFINAPASGGLAMLHGAEIVAPLDSPQGKVLTAINDLMNNKAATGAGEYSGISPMIIDNSGRQRANTNNTSISTSNYTIQQGITPDDFLKRDFLNFSY